MSKFKTKKSLGQNFLNDNSVIEKIIEVSKLTIDENVLEIGPGQGALTNHLVAKANKVQVVEIDNRLIPILKKKYETQENFEILHKDFLETSKKDFSFLINQQDIKEIKMIANLPYYITTPIIIKTLTEYDFIKDLVIMVQKEVALRFTSNYKNKTYGSVTVFLQTLATVKYEFTVHKESFEPMPKIDSAIISLKSKENIPQNIKENLEKYSEFLKNCFRQKRKLLSNNLCQSYGYSKQEIENFLIKQGFGNKIRPEEIKVEEYISLYTNWMKMEENAK